MKRNRIHLYLIRLLAGGLLTGCTVGPVEEIVPEENRPVAIYFSKPDLGMPDVVTRADTPARTPLPAGATVRICAYPIGTLSDASTTPAVFATTEPAFEATYVVGKDGALSPCRVSDDGKQIEGDAGGLTVRGGIYDFYAVSPARSLKKDTDSNYKITGIQHQEDVMTSTKRNVKISKDSYQVTLDPFKRKCALVVFNVASATDHAVSFKTLSATGLVIKKISSSNAALIAGDNTGITPTGGTAGAAGEVTFTEDDFEPVESGNDPNNYGLNKTKGVILPKTNAPFDVEITVKRNDETATLKATIDQSITFEAGKRYVFTLVVKNNESSLTMSAVEWSKITFEDGNVGDPTEKYPDPDIYVGPGVIMTVATWKDITWMGNGPIGGKPNAISIDSKVVDSYKAAGVDFTVFPPFNYDGGVSSGTKGSDRNGESLTCTLHEPYYIEVEQGEGQPATNHVAAVSYCSGKGWRLPTTIELRAMYENKATLEKNGCDAFSGYYWSSSVYKAHNSRRCVLIFNNGSTSGHIDFYDIESNNVHVRCVRDN